MACHSGSLPGQQPPWPTFHREWRTPSESPTSAPTKRSAKFLTGDPLIEPPSNLLDIVTLEVLRGVKEAKPAQKYKAPHRVAHPHTFHFL